ncbi:3-phosphoshikimate 1-carboxyvinyltransferase [Flavobacterium sp. HSC-61S13]|uniref:3-phosphoshikimate 1-carboxyvinyltransferase n=1 Tax=Flavobacterium sp. HSC-61S13 TaxID=2910963 RepID=UPI00209CAA69|nr:3-phosphoshikimate 1-carboxyvinyltransferase [Flavobacterium sp. HSC-61S13]MCP1996929.1 3-phosphoshikimate 1-carboxyvinyltransferase [Flavobacterium sp. HSC-61S13]
MRVDIQRSSIINNQRIRVSGSKSQTNRLLLLQKLYPNIHLQNISDSDDSQMMQHGLVADQEVVDIHHAGTAMRFLTAYFAMQPNRQVWLTGSSRMKERPISILVEALRQLGATIEYVEKEGFPPLKITGRKLTANQVTLNPAISSQYISALLLIAPQLENGLTLTFNGEVTSKPYIEMTLSVLSELGIPNQFVDNTVRVDYQAKVADSEIIIESDWSSASYFYSIIALAEVGTAITLSNYQERSLQGDARLVAYYRSLGVKSVFQDQCLTLIKQSESVKYFEADLRDTPDLAQTIAVTCFGLGIGCELSGLHTLKIKETDRLLALQIELTKLGAVVSIDGDGLKIEAGCSLISGVAIDTYQDHRMAMAFAPLALKTSISIKDAEVVSKSFIDFWENLQTLGFQATIVDTNPTYLK